MRSGAVVGEDLANVVCPACDFKGRVVKDEVLSRKLNDAYYYCGACHVGLIADDLKSQLDAEGLEDF